MSTQSFVLSSDARPRETHRCRVGRRDPACYGKAVPSLKKARLSVSAQGHVSSRRKMSRRRPHPVRDSGVGRCFVTTVQEGLFSWDFDKKARRYDEELLCGRYVITTSLDVKAADCAQVLRYYRSLQNLEHRFWIAEDFLALRPVFHWTKERVRAHVALCLLAATIEAVMAKDLVAAKVMDPNLPFQHMTPRRALAELAEVRLDSWVPVTHYRARQPTDSATGHHPAGLRGGHLGLAEGHTRLIRANRARVVETLRPRPLIYLGFRKGPARISRLRQLNSSIATPHRSDLGELWIKSGFRCVM